MQPTSAEFMDDVPPLAKGIHVSGRCSLPNAETLELIKEQKGSAFCQRNISKFFVTSLSVDGAGVDIRFDNPVNLEMWNNIRIPVEVLQKLIDACHHTAENEEMEEDDEDDQRDEMGEH